MTDVRKPWWRAAHDWLWRPEWPHGFAAFRALFGAALAGYLLNKAPYVAEAYGRAGFHYLPAGGWAFAPLPDVAAWALYGVTLAAVIAVMLGFRTRVAAAVALGGMLWLFGIDYHFQYHAFDYHAHLILLIFILQAGADDVFALSANMNAAAVHRRPLPGAKAVMLLVAFVYFFGALHKIVGGAWHGWEMAFYTWRGAYATDVSLWLSAHAPRWFMAAGTLGTLLLELFAPLLLFVPSLRRFGIASLVLFHSFLALTMYGIWQFSFMFMSSFVLFADQEWVRHWLSAALSPFAGRLTAWYDAGCRLCVMTGHWLKGRTLAEISFKDMRGITPFSVIPAKAGIHRVRGNGDMDSRLRGNDIEKGMLVEWHGARLRGYDAVLALLAHDANPLVRAKALLGQLPFVRALGRLIYFFVARYRKGVFGTCEGEHCEIR